MIAGRRSLGIYSVFRLQFRVFECGIRATGWPGWMYMKVFSV